MEKVVFCFKIIVDHREYYYLMGVTSEAETDIRKAEIIKSIKESPEYPHRFYPIPVMDVITNQMLREYFVIADNIVIEVKIIK